MLRRVVVMKASYRARMSRYASLYQFYLAMALEATVWVMIILRFILHEKIPRAKKAKDE